MIMYEIKNILFFCAQTNSISVQRCVVSSLNRRRQNSKKIFLCDGKNVHSITTCSPLFSSVCVLYRAEVALDQSLCGRLVMEAGRRTAVTVMDTPTAFTLCPLAAPLSMETCPGTARPALLHSLQPTAAETSTRSRL